MSHQEILTALRETEALIELALSLARRGEYKQALDALSDASYRLNRTIPQADTEKLLDHKSGLRRRSSKLFNKIGRAEAEILAMPEMRKCHNTIMQGLDYVEEALSHVTAIAERGDHRRAFSVIYDAEKKLRKIYDEDEYDLIPCSVELHHKCMNLLLDIGELKENIGGMRNIENPVTMTSFGKALIFPPTRYGEDISFVYEPEDFASTIIKPEFSDKQPWQMTYGEFSDFCAKNDYWCYSEKRSPLYFSVPVLRDPRYTYDAPGKIVGIRTKETWLPSHTDIEALKASMEQAGWVTPVCLHFLIQDRISVIDGTHRIWMAFELGWEKIPFYFTPASIKSNRMGPAHQFVVMLALKEGRPVPRKVLEQYYKTRKGEWWEHEW
jgi:hypothetical protein